MLLHSPQRKISTVTRGGQETRTRVAEPTNRTDLSIFCSGSDLLLDLLLESADLGPSGDGAASRSSDVLRGENSEVRIFFMAMGEFPTGRRWGIAALGTQQSTRDEVAMFAQTNLRVVNPSRFVETNKPATDAVDDETPPRMRPHVTMQGYSLATLLFSADPLWLRGVMGLCGP